MASRRLSPDERAVWSRVARSVRATAGGSKKEQVPPPAPPASAEGEQSAPAFSPPRLGRGVGGGSSSSTSQNTLDGSWDRSIAKGQIVPDRTIDLHGCSLAQAHVRLERGLALAVADRVRVLLLVTGKAPRADASRIDLPLRGIIRASVGDWIAASRHSASVAAVRAAHPRHGGSGALYLILRRKR